MIYFIVMLMILASMWLRNTVWMNRLFKYQKHYYYYLNAQHVKYFNLIFYSITALNVVACIRWLWGIIQVSIVMRIFMRNLNFFYIHWRQMLILFVRFCFFEITEKNHIDGGAAGVVDDITDHMDFSRNLFLYSQSIRWTVRYLWKMDTNYSA